MTVTRTDRRPRRHSAVAGGFAHPGRPHHTGARSGHAAGWLKPVIQGLNRGMSTRCPRPWYRCSRGRAARWDSLLSQTSSFTTGLADNSQVNEDPIDNPRRWWTRTWHAVLRDPRPTSKLVTQLGGPDPIGSAIESLDRGTRVIDRPARLHHLLTADISQPGPAGSPARRRQSSCLDGSCSAHPATTRSSAGLTAAGSTLHLRTVRPHQ